MIDALFLEHRGEMAERIVATSAAGGAARQPDLCEEGQSS